VLPAVFFCAPCPSKGLPATAWALIPPAPPISRRNPDIPVMIEHLRKYTGLMMVALAAVFVGLVFLVGPSLSRGSGGTGQAYMKIGDRTYSYEEFTLLGKNSLQVASELRMNMMVAQLAGNMWQPDVNKFFIHRMLLRQAQDEFGVHPSDAEITDYIQNRSAFAQNGNFNQEAYNQFIAKRIGRYGLNEKHVRDLVRDFLAYEKLFEITGSGLLTNIDYARRFYADQNQKIALEVVEFPLSKHQGTIEPTEEEIKTFWEENQDAYTTEDRRKFSYFVLMPESAKPAVETPAPKPPAKAEPTPAPKPPAESAKSEPAPAAAPATDDKAPEASGETAPAAPATEGTPAPAAPSTDSTAAGDTTTTPAPANPAPAPQMKFTPLPTGEAAPAPAPPDPAAIAKKAAEDEARKEAELKLAGSVDTFLGELEDSEGAEFEKLAEKHGWKIKKSEWATRKTLPSDLNRPVRSGQQGLDMAFYLFDKLTKTPDPISIFTPAIPIAGGGWVIARLDEEDPVHPKSYKEARAEARTDLIRQRATEAMKKEAEEALTKLKKAVEEDKKPFAEAAKELEVEPKSIAPFGRGDRPDGLVEPQQIFETAARVDPGHFADIVNLSDRSIIVFVAKRTLVREDNLETRIEGFADNMTNRNRYIAFDAWLANGRESAKMLTPKN